MTSTRPLFTIVIPTYNRGSYIVQTLDSVFNQSFGDFEVIVVDNASEDNTLEILEPYVQAGKIKLIVHEKNHERARSRNTGQLNAAGEYLTFLDSDDFMYPDNLKDAAAFAEANRDLKIFHNLYELVDDAKRPIHRFHFRPLTDPLWEIARGNFLSCIGVFIHREVYSTIYWDENPVLVGSEDYEFWLRVIARYREVGRIAKLNSGIRDHAGRTMNNIQLDSTAQRFAYIINKIHADPVYREVYGKYIGTMEANFSLFLANVAKEANPGLLHHYLYAAWKADARIIFTRGFYSAFFSWFKQVFKKVK